MPYITEETAWRESIIRDVRRGRILLPAHAAELLGCTERHVYNLLLQGTFNQPTD